jgi:hypothetical protein
VNGFFKPPAFAQQAGFYSEKREPEIKFKFAKEILVFNRVNGKFEIARIYYGK